MPGPQSGPQPDVKYCPNCKGSLVNVNSRNQVVPDSHRYECKDCKKEFEINDME
jgi:transposase-like protein